MSHPPASVSKPLSPHLQIYKFQITSVLSILHRLTGVGLFVGAGGLIKWLFLTAFVEREPFQTFYVMYIGLLNHPIGQFFCWVIVFCAIYHWANGVRHLAWDHGYGFNLNTVARTGWFVIIFSAVVTGGLFYCWR